MGSINLNNIRVHANHGCLREESLIGSDYRVDLTVWADLSQAALSDVLSETVDYVHLNNIVKEEMAIRSKLLEHVALRISNRVLEEIAMVSKIQVTVSKINPPIGGDVESVSVNIETTR